MTQLSALLLSALLLSSDVSVTTRDGQTVSGQLEELSVESASVRTGTELTRIGRNNIDRIDFPKGTQPAGKSKILIELTDGSKLNADSFMVSQDSSKMSISADVTTDIPTKNVRFVRFSEAEESLDRQWNEVLASRANADVIVVRRPDNVLDFLEGVIADVTAENVKFQFDGEWIDVRMNKVDGLVYYHADQPVYASAPIRVTLVGDSVINAETIQLKDDKIEIQSMNRATIDLPLTRLASLGFQSGNTVYLSDLDPEATDWNSAVPSASVSDELQRLYQPRRDLRMLGGKLEVVSELKRRNSRRFEKGLAIHSRTELTYRLAGEYRTFQAIAGIDPSFAAIGDAQLIFVGDGHELASQRIKGTEAAHAFDFSVSGVQRLKIVVDYGDESDQGDYVNLCDARLTK